MKHPSLKRGAANLVAGEWREIQGDAVVSRNPAQPASVVWSGSPAISHVDDAVASAREAFPKWAAWPMERRVSVLRRYQAICKERESAIAELIADETGKVMWDSKGEAALLGAKVDITLDDAATGAMRRVSGFEVPIAAGRVGRASFRPHGVMAVLGPYNFPAHLPNGHIVPALVMGNTVVLKPSDKTPAVGQLLGELFQDALDAEGAPRGVFNVVHGAADVASSLSRHSGVDGILFTGSWPVGRRILEANLDRPSRMIALEMGGNNPAVVMPDSDLKQALIECVRCAFITTGQRCTCTRRLILHEAIAGRFLSAFAKATSNLLVGDPRAAHPVFMGPIINEASRRAVLDFQAQLAKAGGEVIVASTAVETAEKGFYLTPSVVRVERFSVSDSMGDAGCDREVFGPLLRVCVVRSLDEAIEQSNATSYGLAASIFTTDAAAQARFLIECKAGCVNVNTGTAGASSKLPFGGLGMSGNHRPAGAFSLDYCAYPTASMIESGTMATTALGMRVEDEWLR